VADDRMSAALAEIRERGYENGAHGAQAARLSDAAAIDVPRLLAAVEAVLKLADDAQEYDTFGSGDMHWDITPDGIREVVRSALTGEEAPGD
jgi:hypothetical protein